jgi:hypothetical protein
MRDYTTTPMSHDRDRGMESAERGTSVLISAVVGALAVFLGSLGGSVIGGAVGYLLGGGDKNVALRVALWGLLIGALLAGSALAWQGTKSRAWSAFAGGTVGIAILASAVAWLVGGRL